MTQKPVGPQEPHGVGARLKQAVGLLNAASLGLLIAGGLSFVAALLTVLLLPDLRSYTLTLAALGLFLILLFVVVAFRSVKTAMLGRRGRYGSNAAIMAIAFAGIIVLANVIAVRNPYRMDVTASKQFSLAQQTLDVLRRLDQPVEAVGFFDPSLSQIQGQAESLLKEYRYHSSRFTYRFVDPDAEPGVARQYEIRGQEDYGSVVFATGIRRQKIPISNITEQDFTGAILRVTGKELKKVRFLAGHDERDSDSFLETGVGEAKRGLQRDNYDVSTVNLTADPEAPKKLADTAALVIAGPRKDLLDQEKKPLEDYLRQGGKLLVLLDPDPPQSVVELLKKWAVDVQPGTVVDQLSFATPDVTAPAVQRAQYLFDRITGTLDTTFFPAATSFKSLIKEPKPSDTVRLSPIAVTSRQSWMAQDAKKPNFDLQRGDIQGPLVLAVAAEGSAPWGEKKEEATPASTAPSAPVRTRIVVIGDSDFATNNYFYSLGNSDLFLNSVSWLAEEETLISIRPKPAGIRLMILTQREFRYVLWSSIALLPIVIAVVGGIVWWRRR
ncbi:MAG: GldG family protein [Chloroflexi bacterium]|nr:GldG family protein [Chloroflexota bacterium]